MENLYNKKVIENWSFLYTPWAKEMLDCKDPHWCSQKGAQLSISEVLINGTLYAMDQHGMSALYGLPSERPDARDFCLTRFNTVLKLSPYIKDMFDGGEKAMSPKMAGTRALYIRGSRGGATFDSIPVGIVSLDEVDKMSQSAVALARERMSGQPNMLFREASTPSIPGRGVNLTFQDSTQDFFTFKCPHCSRWTHLIFPDCLVITATDSKDPGLKNSYLKCKECQHELKHEEKPIFLGSGKWEHTHSQRNIRGFHISQLYSCVLHPSRLAQSYLNSTHNPADEQTFFNSKLGEAHIVAGAAVTDEHINACKRFYVNQAPATSPVVTMGIDVGSELHFKIIEYRFEPVIFDVNMNSQARLLYYGKIAKKDKDPSYSALHYWVSKYNPVHICIDAAPERTSSEFFVKQYPYRAHTVNYHDSVDGKELSCPEHYKITANRSYWIDTYLGRYINKTIEIPQDVNTEFCVHVKGLTRMYEKDKNDEVVTRHVKGASRTDYAHCGVYCEIALKKAMESGYLGNIKVST